MREIRFGVIGAGLMGREFASAAARWAHLADIGVRPRIVAVCDTNPAMTDWFSRNVPTVEHVTGDYRTLVDRRDVDAVYCAVPHNLHADLYVAILAAGKHLLGEKPFGIDLEANQRVLAAIEHHPGLLVRCSSEFPFYPGAYRLWKLIDSSASFGRIIEVNAGFLHSSDLDPSKPINWKRQVATNGEYGCMGDLGMHVLHLPLRAGWVPLSVRALLSDVVTERPGPDGELVRCETWDNAVLATEVRHADGYLFPMLLETKRIAPGETNTWYLRVLGTQLSAEYSTKYPKTFRSLPYSPGEPQAWRSLDLGYESAYPAVTGGIFEFGFPDALLQMWAAFCDELAHGPDGMRQGLTCVTPTETAQHHAILTAALRSQAEEATIAIADPVPA